MRACVNCQKRKSRCMRGSSGSSGPCSYCSRTGKTCSFETPPNRTPLTRKNLDACERRCAQLRSLLSTLNPDLDVDLALDGLKSGNRDTAPGQASEESDECTPESYEWHEGSLSPEDKSNAPEDAVASDGMATLSRDAGYLGSSSGSQLLQEIDAVISNSTRPSSRRTHKKPSHLGLPPPDAPDLSLSHDADILIDAYFKLYNTCYPILHERTFRDRVAAKHQHRPGRTPWRVTYYMVLAIGHWASTTEAEHAQTRYYAAARSSLSLQMLESGTMETIIAFLLMGNYLQKRDRTNTGYNFIGLAYRLALGLGLHREPSGPENTVGHERRRQIFWTIYCFETGFNITTGRPPSINAEGFSDVRLPSNIDDKDLTFTSPVPPEVDYPTTYSAIIWHTKLAQISDSIYREFLLAKTAGSKIEFNVAEAMERDLLQWRKSLPSYFAPTEAPAWFQSPASLLLWREQNVRILLWRGSQKQHSFLPTRITADDRCLETAMHTIHDIEVFCAEHNGSIPRSVSWYATYYLFQAALVLAASLLNKSSTRPPLEQEMSWQHSITRAREALLVLSSTNKSATRCVQILDQIHSQLKMHQDTSQGTGDVASQQQGNSTINNPNNTQPLLEPSALPENIGLQSENDFAFFDNNHNFGGIDETIDPNFRMLINEMPFDLMENMPLDLLLSDWGE